MSTQLFKIMLAGDVSTGKTSFLSQLIYQTPHRNPQPTQNLTFFALRLTNPNVMLQIWDSPGDPRYHFQVISGLASFRVLLLFVDITNDHTLDLARNYIECNPPQIQNYAATPVSKST
jgi:GTPase SAR1 family protein